MITIEGKVHFQNLGTGFWSIISNDGKKWRPVNMPAPLQEEGKTVSLQAKKVNDVSVFMWGTAVEILSF